MAKQRTQRQVLVVKAKNIAALPRVSGSSKVTIKQARDNKSIAGLLGKLITDARKLESCSTATNTEEIARFDSGAHFDPAFFMDALASGYGTTFESEDKYQPVSTVHDTVTLGFQLLNPVPGTARTSLINPRPAARRDEVRRLQINLPLPPRVFRSIDQIFVHAARSDRRPVIRHPVSKRGDYGKELDPSADERINGITAESRRRGYPAYAKNQGQP
jgi:hypothetical protein